MKAASNEAMTLVMERKGKRRGEAGEGGGKEDGQSSVHSKTPEGDERQPFLRLTWQNQGFLEQQSAEM